MDRDNALRKTGKRTNPRLRANSTSFELSWLWVFIPLLVLTFQVAQRSLGTWIESGSPLFFQLWVPLAASYLAWANRGDWEQTQAELAQLFPDPKSPKRLGNLSLIVLGGVGLIVASLASMLPLLFFSLWLLVAGSIFYLYGPFLLRVILKPLFFLLLAIPPPTGVLSQLVGAFQVMTAAAIGQTVQTLGIKVRISGNAITLLSSMKRIEISPSYTGLGVFLFVVTAALFLILLHRTRLGASLAILFIAVASAIFMNCVRLVSLVIVVSKCAWDKPDLAESLYRIPALPTLVGALGLLWLLGRRFLKPRAHEDYSARKDVAR